MATGAALYLTADYDACTDLFLPISYRSLRVYRRFPVRIYSHIRARGDKLVRSEVESFDVTMYDEHGEMIAEIDGFAMRRIVDPAKALADGHESAGTGPDSLIDVPARTGIQPGEGAKALTRILLSATPNSVVAVPEPLAELAPETPAAAKVAKEAAGRAAPAVPTGAMEEVLITWWQELLGADEVGLDDDFFDLGGHSLVGVRLLAKIKKTYQADLELAVLFEARTVRQLAMLIRKTQQPTGAAEQAAQKTWTALVPVQPNGLKIPIFCVHAVGGDVLFYEELSRALGSDQPFYAFQSPLVAEPDRRDLTIEEMASLYIREMRAFYPEGPYFLAAASYGGFVLYEMARQLQEQGVTPGIVVMFDVTVPGSGESLGTEAKFSTFLGNIRAGGLKYLAKKLREKSEYFWDRLREGAIYPAAVRCYRLANWTLPPALRFYWISQGHWYTLRHYEFKPFAGKITLVKATDRGPEVLGTREDPTLGWGGLALGGLDIIEVPTKHMYMLFEPYVTEFAKTLEKVLEEQGVGSRE